MARHAKGADTLDMFSYEFYDITQDVDIKDEVQHGQASDMFDRTCTLLASSPLTNAGFDTRRAPFHLLDQRSIALQALNFSIGSVGLGSISEGGIQRSSMIDHLKAVIHEQLENVDGDFEYPTDKQIEDYAGDIIKQLMTQQEAQVYHPTSKMFKTFEFRVLKEVDDDYGNFYLRPSLESTNLFLGSLKMSLRDDQIMLQALLEHQIKQGLIKNAFKTARTLRTRTIFFKEEVLVLKRRISLNVRALHWDQHVMAKISEVKESLPALLQTNRRILQSVQNNHDLRSSDRGPIAAALSKAITDCIDIHKTLTLELHSLDSHYRAEQSRQSFFSRSRETLPNMVEDVLVPMMMIRKDYVVEAANSLLAVFRAPAALPIFDLKSTVLTALREKKVFEYEPAEDVDLDLVVAANEEPPKFTHGDVEKAADFILDEVRTKPKLLSRIMSDAADQGLKKCVRHAMAVLVVTTWSYENYRGQWRVDKTEDNFSNDICTSNEFRITFMKEEPDNGDQ